MVNNRSIVLVVVAVLVALAALTLQNIFAVSKLVSTASLISNGSARPPELYNSNQGQDGAGYFSQTNSNVAANRSARPPELYSAPERQNLSGYFGQIHSNVPVVVTETQRPPELAADSTVAGASERYGKMTDRILELLGRQEAAGQTQLAQIRAATAQFHQIPAAEAAGYHLVPGLDYCFDNPGVGGMGVHYIKTSSLDLNLDPLQPEAMVYAVGANGQLQLGAVEYIVPAAAWDAAGNTQPPTVFGHNLHLNKGLGVYVLHAWIWQENPSGMFQDWNPKVSCP